MGASLVLSINFCRLIFDKMETEPERGVYTFAQADQIAQLAKQGGKLLRGSYMETILYLLDHADTISLRTQLRMV